MFANWVSFEVVKTLCLSVLHGIEDCVNLSLLQEMSVLISGKTAVKTAPADHKTGPQKILAHILTCQTSPWGAA